MRKNAGIKSKKELARRLIDGEEFFLGDVRIFFDENKVPPFRYGNVSVMTSWEYVERMQMGVDWRDNIGDGVLCWVWDDNPNDKCMRDICKYRPNKKFCYIASNGAGWKNAQPMTREEVEKYILE